MPDELDQMLQGEDQNVPAGSQQQDGTGSNSNDQTNGQGGQIEEVEFSKLTGSAQDRFRKLYQEKQQAQAELHKMRQLVQQGGGQQPAPGAQGLTTEVQEAVKRLDDVGIATKDFVKEQVQSILAQKTYYDELDKLESQLNGNDGKPKFTREEYFDYIDKHPQYKNYLPQDVYSKMYEDELFDWKAKNGNQQATGRTQQLRPTRSASREQELTVDEIEAKLKSLPEPQRSEWYSANKKRIDAAASKMSQHQ